VTTLTTCGSFAIGATSPLPLVQSFCIFAAVVVLVPWWKDGGRQERLGNPWEIHGKSMGNPWEIRHL
jgi:hypothetical protein